MDFNNLDHLYRQVIMDHYKTPRNRGAIEGGVTIDMNNPTCGDTIRLQLAIEDDVVRDAKFDLGDVEALSGVTKFPARIKCATLAWKALERGVEEGK